MRISNQWMVSSFLRSLNRNHTDLTRVQEQISSGKNYTAPSQAPVANALAMHHKTEIAEHDQYIRNLDRTVEFFNTTDASLTSVEVMLQRVRELAVQGANDTLVQQDRDAIAREIDELLGHLYEIANTNVGGEYVFAGSDVTTKPFQQVTGQSPNQMTGVVTYSSGDTRANLNLNNLLDVRYLGDRHQFAAEIEKGVLLNRNVPGAELFFRGLPSNPAPTFTNAAPALSRMLPLSALNGGRGVEAGGIYLTDANGVDTWVDLKDARRLDDVLHFIDQTRGFTAGIEEVPSDTAVALGIYRTAGPTNTLLGLSDPKMMSVNTPLSDLQNGTGVPPGFLSINLRDGTNLRVDLSTATTVGNVVALINAAGGPLLTAEFDMVNRRLELTDRTGGRGEFSVESRRNQLYVKDLPAQVADDLGLNKNVGAANVILADFDPAIQSEGTELQFLNGGAGVEKGFVRIIGHDGTARVIDLTAATTVQEVIDAINVQTGGAQTAAWDVGTRRLTLTDHTIGAADFQVQEVDGLGNPPVPLPVQVREATTVAGRLGLLKMSQGATVVGDSLALGVTAATPLAALVPAPDTGAIKLWDTTGTVHEIDLSQAQTIQDVIDTINLEGTFTAAWDNANRRLIVADQTQPVGSHGMRVEERTNPARDLGLIGAVNHFTPETLTGEALTIQALPTLVGGIDLQPALHGSTELRLLNHGRTFNQGVNLGLVRITDKAGHFATIDFRNARTVQDVLDLINDPANGLFIQARINQNQNGIEIIDRNHGAAGKLSVVDVNSTCAADLGIAAVTADTRIVGRDVDPAVAESTLIASLNGGNGVPLGKVYVQSGEFSGEIDLTGVRTVKDLLERLTTADTRFNLTAWIDPDGSRINLTNTKGQPYLKVRDLGENGQGAASALGLGASRSIFQTLADLRDSLYRNDATAISEQSLKVIDEDLERVLQWHAETGARTNRATSSQERLTTNKLHLNKLLDVVENVDVAEAMMRLTQLQQAFEAALASGSRMMQTSLLDFLR